ncbi:MAG: Gfo/Idh/MocA family oxidoreductase [Armatimonadetes bacterium]|nr:Gfo/Idh/MocA family oxidoreductase [Armatimonadota bacterium]
MAQTVRLGFVGAGGMAKAHTDAIKDMPDVEIAAVTDAHRPAAEALAGRFGAQVFDTPEQLAADAGVDAVYILLPPFAHGEAERAALGHNLPFFVEKPVGLDLGLAREIAAEVEHKGLLTGAGYMNRYRQSVNAARELLQQDPPILAYGGWWGGSPGPAREAGIGSWWTDKSKSGGQFHEQVTHTVDLVRYLFGDAEEVFAYAATGFNKDIPGYSIDDAATVAIKFQNGGIANLMSSVSSNAGGGILLNVHSLSANVQFTGWEHSVTLRKKGEPAQEIKGEDNIFGIEDAAFLQAVRTGDGSGVRATYPDAVRTLAISVAANQSIATGKPVAV